MNAPTTRKGTVSPVRAAGRWGIALGLLLIVGTGLALLPLPAGLTTLIVLPLLVLVAGTALVTLLLGPARGTDATLTDPGLRCSLIPVAGVLVALAAVLLLAVAGIRLDAVSMPLGLGVLALVLVAAAVLVRLREPLRPGVRLPHLSIRPVLGLLAAVAVLGAAIGLAQVIRPPVIEQYTMLRFTGSDGATSSPLTAPAGGTVTLTYALDSFHQPAVDPLPAIEVLVAGVTADQVEASWMAGPADQGQVAVQPGVTATSSGRATFLAPQAPGLYKVTVVAHGNPVVSHQPMVTTLLEVTP